MKINELLAKINTVVFYVLSALEYNYHAMILAEKSENGDEIEVKTFFRDHHNFGRKK